MSAHKKGTCARCFHRNDTEGPYCSRCASADSCGAGGYGEHLVERSEVHRPQHALQESDVPRPPRFRSRSQRRSAVDLSEWELNLAMRRR